MISAESPFRPTDTSLGVEAYQRSISHDDAVALKLNRPVSEASFSLLANIPAPIKWVSYLVFSPLL